METIHKHGQLIERHSKFATFLKKLIYKFKELFEPEEVEVTFKVEGKKISYTYTKVEPKRVA